MAGWMQQRMPASNVAIACCSNFQNSPQFMIGYYAILRADAFIVPVNPMLKTDELRHYVDDSGARVRPVRAGQLDAVRSRSCAVEDRRHRASLEHALVGAYADALTSSPPISRYPTFIRAPLAGRGRVTDVTRWTDAIDREPRVPATSHRSGLDDFCVMPYTSGTTGQVRRAASTRIAR